MKNILRIVGAVILVTAFTSCRSTKKLQTAVNKKDTVITIKNIPAPDSLKAGNDLVGTLIRNRINFKTFSAKIKVEYEDTKGKQPDVNAFVRMQKDSIIWISINATFLSIEAFRILITKDHVTILNKLQKQVEEHPFSFIESIAKIPLDFKTLQDLIVGNPVFLGDKVVAYKVTENHILLSTIGKYFKNLLTLSTTDNLIERSKLDDLDVTLNRTGDLTYGDYENKSGVFFSTYREITVAEKTKVDIKLNFKQYDFNTELSYPFSVPKNYKTK
ncbi:MAG: hypothetical protein JWO92_1711 [Chitinophagaceae bacterium]|nr:hypothetical protein [Chitinophagaceae bacterium]MDB5223748.1 hypothetical protein [Chitinophagaceae bacterium]